MTETPIPLLIKETSRSIRVGFESLFSDKDIRPVDGRILCRVIEDESLSSADIQAMFSLSKASVSESLHALASRGYIEYVCSPNSKREKRIVATEKGRACHEEIRRSIERFDSEAIAGLTEKEVEELARLLRVVSSNVERSGS